MSGAEFLKSLPLVRNEGDTTSFKIRGVEIGGAAPVVIAGPCAVESAEQLLSIAKFVKSCGAVGLRGGVFKPRSSPYSFQGLGQEGLEYLALARKESGLFTVVEVTSIAQIAQVDAYADVIQIGARNMQNFELLKAVGRSARPILLKRGLSATIQELLQAAEYIMSEGNPRVMLCERGIRTFETFTRNTLDINAIPLLKQLTHLPILADPSHGTGRSDLVPPVSKAALAAGADGIIIEVHPNPDVALSDGNQSLNFPEFKTLMSELPAYTAKVEDYPMAQLTPSSNDFKAYAAAGYRYIPVSVELTIDAETPVTIFNKLAEGEGRFLLESVERGEQIGRYSFIGWEPLFTLKANGRTLQITDNTGQTVTEEAEPLERLEQALRELRVAPVTHLGKFYGGAVGYIGYDYVKQIERIPDNNPSIIGIPDLCWIVPRYLACFDHVMHKITLVVLAKAEPEGLEQSYQTATLALQTIIARLNSDQHLAPLRTGSQSVTPESSYSLTKAEFMERVGRIKEYILAGDAFQVVLSQRITRPYSGDPFYFYRSLRTINPSPYLFYLDFGGFQLVGSSPEVMVRHEAGRVILKPIAGTRRRGVSAAEDACLREELLQDEKERAEHIMLVDLGRNDLGRIAKYGSVRVTELMNVENYSHVMHIVSTIHGELNAGLSGSDLIRAVFPAGTLSGAPKVRAMEIIAELEPVRREFYGGAVGYLGFNGNLDTCITIRTVLFKDQQVFLQVGAGIVADSVPETEYEETMNKAGALLTALARVGGTKNVVNH